MVWKYQGSIDKLQIELILIVVISTRGLIGTFRVPEPVGGFNIQCTLFTPGAGTQVVNGTVAV